MTLCFRNYLYILEIKIMVYFQGKKLPAYITDEGEVTDEDEGAEQEKKKNNKKVN